MLFHGKKYKLSNIFIETPIFERLSHRKNLLEFELELKIEGNPNDVKELERCRNGIGVFRAHSKVSSQN